MLILPGHGLPIFDLCFRSQPVLLMALDDYFSDPSQDCLARLFDAVNSMDLSGAPILTRQEKMVMRSSERKDIFAEKFAHLAPRDPSGNTSKAGSGTSKPTHRHRPTNSTESYSSFEEGLMMRNREKERTVDENRAREGWERADRDSGTTAVSTQQHAHNPNSPSDSSFSLGGSAVWVGDESGLEIASADAGNRSSVVSLVGSTTLVGHGGRQSADASSSSHGKDHTLRLPTNATSYYDPQLRPGMAKDTHFFHTSVAYKGHQLPIKMPLSTFPEEVGDVRDVPPISKSERNTNARNLVLVLFNHSRQGFLVPSTSFWPTPSPSPHKRPSNTPHYHSVQRACNG